MPGDCFMARKLHHVVCAETMKSRKYRLPSSVSSGFNLHAKMKAQEQLINAICRFSFAAWANGGLPDF
jgi:hypothetical protein